MPEEFSTSDAKTPVGSLDPAGIGVRARWRNAIDREALQKLKTSISAIGLRTPISVRLVDGKWELVAGLHRLTAYRELNIVEPGGRWEKIPVREEDADEIDAKLWEISENLHHVELTVAERAAHITEWIRLCEARDKPLQLATVSNQIGGRGNEGGVNAAARDLGIERTEAQRAVKIDALAPKARAEARTLGLDNNQSALLKAANQPDAEAQINSLREHAAARAARKATPKPADPVSSETVSLAELGAQAAAAMGKEPAADPEVDIAASLTALSDDQRAMVVAKAFNAPPAQPAPEPRVDPPYWSPLVKAFSDEFVASPIRALAALNKQLATYNLPSAIPRKRRVRLALDYIAALDLGLDDLTASPGADDVEGSATNATRS